MSTYALPCVVCGRLLREALPDHSENQPNDGVCAVIHGNYGSTVFDPFDGTHLEVNLCDPCLTLAGAQGRVLVGRRSRRVSLEGYAIGHELLDTPLVPWHRGLPGYDDVLDLSIDELGHLPKTVQIDEEAVRMVKKILQAEDEVAREIGWDSVTESGPEEWGESDIWVEADAAKPTVDWAVSAGYSVPPDHCPICDNPTQYDPSDPSVGVMNGVVYCETCTWGMSLPY
jgi:hypothetical protein